MKKNKTTGTALQTVKKETMPQPTKKAKEPKAGKQPTVATEPKSPKKKDSKAAEKATAIAKEAKKKKETTTDNKAPEASGKATKEKESKKVIDLSKDQKNLKKKKKAEKEAEALNLGILIQKARQQKGLTQEQVAELSGTNKSYISKLEKNLKDLRISTLQRIIAEGLDGTLEITIKVK